MPSRQRRGSAAPAAAPQIQPSFPPNPVPPQRETREEPEERLYEVTGLQEVGGVRAPGTVRLTLTRGAEAALIESGNVVPAQEESAPEEEQAPEEPEPSQPMTGEAKEGD